MINTKNIPSYGYYLIFLFSFLNSFLNISCIFSILLNSLVAIGLIYGKYSMFDDELVQPSVIKFSKKAQHSQHFYVLYVGWLIVYKCPVDTSDPSSREQVVTRVPLRACSVAERLPPGQKGGKEHSFQINIGNPERYNALFPRSTVECWLSESFWMSQSERREVQQDCFPSSQ